MEALHTLGNYNKFFFTPHNVLIPWGPSLSFLGHQIVSPPGKLSRYWRLRPQGQEHWRIREELL